jgi:Domain of unknown function (DUF4375)
MNKAVFELQVYRSRWEGYDPREMPEWDGVLIEFPDWEYLRIAFWKPEPITGLPERIAFDAGYEDLSRMDFLYNNAQWPIMSKPMLNTLLSVSEFPHQAISIVMIDDQVDWFTDKRTGRESDDFIALQLIEHLDLFDWEQSVYQRNSLNPNLFNSLETLVLKTPENGYPPIFRLATLPRRLFVSAQARTALEAAGLHGLKFIPLDQFEFQSGDILTLGTHPDLRPTMSRHEFESINDPPYDEQYFSYNYQEPLFDPIAGYIFRNGSRDSGEIDIFRTLTPGQKALYTLTEFLGQTYNGGFPQFFYNKSPFIHRRVSEGLDLIGDLEMKEIYDHELQLYQKGQGEGNSSPFLKFFLAHKRTLEGKLVDYINAHPDEFVIFSDD